METWDAIRSRRDVRTYSQRPLEAEQLDRILEAGWRSPSAANRQKWDFVLVTEPRVLHELAGTSESAAHVASAQAAIVLVLPEEKSDRLREMDQFDLGQATMAMMLAAADLGIGTGHASVGDDAACRALLAVPGGHVCAYMIALGYPADRPLVPLARPKRRPIGDVVHKEGW